MALESLPWGFSEFAMDSFGSVWNQQNDLFSQNTEELKQRLLQTTLELETLRSNSINELKKKDDTINQLINLVKLTTKERDEAKDQLNSVLSYLQSKNLNSNSQQPVNSSLTDSDSLSSPVESFHHAESSYINHNNHNYNSKYDNGSMMIDGLAKRRPLPEKGTLLHAVMSAGPLLQTLMVAGPLPTWRNPPPVQKFQSAHLAVGSQSSQFGMKRQIMASMENRVNEDFSGKRLRIV
ncbi:hypothetical protein LUZ60_003931 [Juncus effusus]|nr:hypothetical protein LUZ60_003931 [Juncus effusus]